MNLRNTLPPLLAIAMMLASCTGPDVTMDPLSSTPQTGALDAYGRRAFNQSYDKLEDILARRDKHEDLPSWTINPFGESQRSNGKRIRALTEEVLEILDLSRVTDLADLHAEAEDDIRQLYEQIAEHKRAMISAPESVPWYSTAETRDDHRQSIERKKGQVAELKTRQARIVTEIEKAFKAGGIEVSGKQVEFFLASISGRSALSVNAVFSNVKQINQHLANLIQTSGEDAETAKKYYGLHVVLIEILVEGHAQGAAKIQEGFIPRVQELLAENAGNRRETQQLLRTTTGPEQRNALEANLRAQDITDKAGNLYVQYLQRQQKRLEQAAHTLEEKFRVARNTYKTAKTAIALVRLIEASDKDLAALRGMELPELIPFENAELQAKFEEISLRLKQEQ